MKVRETKKKLHKQWEHWMTWTALRLGEMLEPLELKLGPSRSNRRPNKFDQPADCLAFGKTTQAWMRNANIICVKESK